jgi:hypothetical protein
MPTHVLASSLNLSNINPTQLQCGGGGGGGGGGGSGSSTIIIIIIIIIHSFIHSYVCNSQ